MALVVPAVAAAACPTVATKQAFKGFGDSASYSLVPQGDFESGGSNWSLTGSSIVSGNEPYRVGAATDKRSLSIQPTGVAVSAPFCVGIVNPTFRFFARQTSGSWATMLVKLRWKDSTGQVNETTVGSLNGSGYTSWKPTPALALSTTLPLWNVDQSLQVQIVFDPENFGGGWAIDDVYVDPRMR